MGTRAERQYANPTWLLKYGKEHPRYVEAPTYNALHSYVHRRLIKPNACEHCKEDKPLDLANKSQKYLRDLDDWLWLCRSCHSKYDASFITHCVHGHEYTEENTYVHNEKRACRICRHNNTVRKRLKTKLLRAKDPIKYLGENL